MWFACQLQGIASEPTVPGDAYGLGIAFLAQLRARQAELDVAGYARCAESVRWMPRPLGSVCCILRPSKVICTTVGATVGATSDWSLV